MDKFAFLQLFVVLITCVKLSQSFMIRVIFIRKDRDQPDLNSCAADLLSKTNYVGVRMKRETGACEGLSSDLATHEEIMDKAYAYAYRLQYDQLYRPPLEYYGLTWTLPGLFESGAQLEVTAIMPPHQTILYVGLHDEQSRDLMHFNINGNGMILDYMNSAKEWKGPRNIGHFEDLTDGKQFKMSYVADANFIKVYLNGKEIVTDHDPILPINSIRKFSLGVGINSEYLPSFVKFKFKHKNSKEAFKTSP